MYFYLKRNLGEHHEVLEFNEWIKNPLKFWHIDDPIRFLDPQYTWIDETVVLIKYENLYKELNQFFGEEINLLVTNKSNHNNYLDYYNKESLDIIYNRYKKDFTKFNYERITKI